MKSFQIHPYIISLIFLFGNTIVAYSENLISESIYQGGLYYGFDHVFSEASPLRFSLNDHNLPGKWSCRLKTTSENMTDIPVDLMVDIVISIQRLCHSTCGKKRLFEHLILWITEMNLHYMFLSVLRVENMMKGVSGWDYFLAGHL